MKSHMNALFALSLILAAPSALAATDLEHDLELARAGHALSAASQFGARGRALDSPMAASLASLVDRCIERPAPIERGELLLSNGGKLSFIATIAGGMDADENAIAFYDADGRAIAAETHVDDSYTTALDYLHDFGSRR